MTYEAAAKSWTPHQVGKRPSALIYKNTLTGAGTFSITNINKCWDTLFLWGKLRAAQSYPGFDNLDVTLIRFNGSTDYYVCYAYLTNTLHTQGFGGAGGLDVGRIPADPNAAAGSYAYFNMWIYYNGRGTIRKTLMRSMMGNYIVGDTSYYVTSSWLWNTVATVTSITVAAVTAPGNLMAGSEIRLYGLRKT